MGVVLWENMEKCILERIAEVKILFSNRMWEKESICKPNNFDSMTREEKDKYRQMVSDKLEEMLKDPCETVYSWTWNTFFEDLNVPFEEWLYNKITFKPLHFERK